MGRPRIILFFLNGHGVISLYTWYTNIILSQGSCTRTYNVSQTCKQNNKGQTPNMASSCVVFKVIHHTANVILWIARLTCSGLSHSWIEFFLPGNRFILTPWADNPIPIYLKEKWIIMKWKVHTPKIKYQTWIYTFN